MEICNEFLGFTGSDNLSVTMRYNIEERGEENGNGENNIDRIL